jgi:Ni/Co efflux regulator RcnB
MGPMGHAQFGYHGHFFNPVHISPFMYPPGYGYRSWGVGAVLPPIFLAPQYYYSDWATLGLDPPPPGAQWVRYGPDLLLVDVATGNVIETVPGAFYE